MQIVLLGATGRTGSRVMDLLIKDGHDLVTLGRRVPVPGIAGVRHLAGNVMDPATLSAALGGADALINCLLSTGEPPLCSTIVAHLAQHHPRLRYVTIAGAAVAMPGDAKGLPDKLIGGALKLLQPKMLEDRQREADLLRGSTLRWTMLRPPALNDGKATGKWQLAWERPAKFRITRSDLAAAVVAALGNAELEGKAPFVSGP